MLLTALSLAAGPTNTKSGDLSSKNWRMRRPQAPASPYSYPSSLPDYMAFLRAIDEF